MLRLVGYALSEDHQHGRHLEPRRHPALSWGVIFPTVEAAEAEAERIFAIERERFERALTCEGPTPEVLKREWDDKVRSSALVECRLSTWNVIWSRDPVPGRSYLSKGTVRIGYEQREAWRDVRQITRTTEAGGIEVIHALGEPGPWTEWHDVVGSPRHYVPHLELAVVPHALTFYGDRKAFASWGKAAEATE